MRGATIRTGLMKQRRFWLICSFFIFWALAITVRLFWLQVVHHSDYVERAQKQQQRTFEVAPRRGILYDRNMRELAMTVQVDSIYAVPNEIDDKDKPALARRLAALVHTDPADAQTSEHEIAKRLAEGRGFAWVARRVTPEISARVRGLNLDGVYFQKEFQRFYPNSQTAAQVLGYVGLDDNGLGGLEQKFDTRLHGTPGQVLTAVDARRHVLGSIEKDPQPGQNLQLTIDSNVQFMAESALDHAMEKTHADNGTIVVQDVHTGQILALAIRPTFDPNDFRHTTPKLLKNHAVSDVYEPGSVFKLVTYSSAIDSQVAKPDDLVDCQGGQITLAGRVIHDDKSDRGMGVVTVATALARSSDVAAVKMALKVGPDRFYHYIRAFGFGARSGVELPGETRGLLRPTNRWNGSSIGSLAIGQEVGVTPVQLVSMVSTIANGGTYLPPRILLTPPTTFDQKSAAPQAPRPFRANEDLPNPLPDGSHRVISELSAAQMRKMMEGVVLYGSGKPAQLNGYSSGGKTGTAQKIDPATHLYSKTMHIASFAGIAPVNNPAIAVAVVIDNPKGALYYGTEVSAPVFADVAQQVLEYLGVPHDIDVHPPKTPAKKEKVDLAEDDAGADQDHVNALFAAVNDLPADDPLRSPQPAAQTAAVPLSTTLNEGSSAPPRPANPSNANSGAAPPSASVVQRSASPPVPVKSAPTQMVTVSDGTKLIVPSLLGLPVRKVIEMASSAGLNVEIVGSGIAREQAPAPGTKVPNGTKIVVRCAH
ncbi:MAG TPA: penicillin-binding transpeptidase domain-containing protein [Terracidiphilus sp.]|jgi:cell division protein FtsI (penicillin-binding protein 3)|nr:penicillin-binding transpeptidase domain-containing protein [Terracidiphilus sp.]